ncbi:hypothetical protein ABMA46_08170 [Mesorhizobium sp. CN5-321]|uniref:hypothetical protein n=1 Tax=Mesorhizobium hunchu TaxID=3157708 RepID=UPI0032B7DEBF
MTTDVKLTARIPADLSAWLAAKAVENDRSQNKEIVALIRAARRASKSLTVGASEHQSPEQGGRDA